MESSNKPKLYIPFLGKHGNEVIFRAQRMLEQHPMRVLATVVVGSAFWYWYDYVRPHTAVVKPSTNHLTYESYDKYSAIEERNLSPTKDATIQEEKVRVHEKINAIKSQLDASHLPSDQRLKEQEKLHELEQYLATTEENVKNEVSTLMVGKGHLYARELYWNIRNNEKNWSVMSRDQQMQKDHYWYRAERGRDDDFGRNAYESRR